MAAPRMCAAAVMGFTDFHSTSVFLMETDDAPKGTAMPSNAAVFSMGPFSCRAPAKPVRFPPALPPSEERASISLSRAGPILTSRNTALAAVTGCPPADREPSVTTASRNEQPVRPLMSAFLKDRDELPAAETLETA